MTTIFWISCRCQVCEEEFEFEGPFEDARAKQREFEYEHYHSGLYRITTSQVEKDAPAQSG